MAQQTKHNAFIIMNSTFETIVLYDNLSFEEYFPVLNKSD